MQTIIIIQITIIIIIITINNRVCFHKNVDYKFFNIISGQSTYLVERKWRCYLSSQMRKSSLSLVLNENITPVKAEI